MALSAARIRGTRAVIAVAGIVVAFGTASIAWDPRNAPVLALDLAVGLAFVALAAFAVPFSVPVTVLSAVVAVTWYAGTAWAPAVFWHRGALTWLLLAFPLLAPGSRLERVAAVAVVAVSIMPFAWSDPVASAGMATLLGAVAAWSVASVHARGRASTTAHVALIGFAVLILAGALVEGSGATGTALPFYVVYEITTGAIAVALMVTLPRPSPSAVADLVIDLDGTPDVTMRERLSRALDDRGVRIGYPDAASGGYRDGDGRSLDPSAPVPGRATTPIVRSGRPVAIIEHDAAPGTARPLVDAIGAATAAVDEHERLTAEIRVRVTEVDAARRRLARAADQERRALRAQLRTTVEEPLEALIRALSDERDPTARIAFARTTEILEGALGELAEAGQGLRPAELDEGLGTAVRALATRSPLAVDVTPGSGTRYPPEVESAMYAACSEALQNAAKHAGVERARIEIDDDAGSLVVRIRDDGPGGADASSGRGLRGLADRVRSVGGDIRIDSPQGRGTLVELRYPRRSS